MPTLLSEAPEIQSHCECSPYVEYFCVEANRKHAQLDLGPGIIIEANLKHAQLDSGPGIVLAT